MKKTLVFPLALLLLLLASFNPALLAQERSSLWPRYKRTSLGKLYGFYSQKQRKFIIEPQYTEAGRFSFGKNRIAAVKNINNQWGYINEKNEIVIPFGDRFAYASRFTNGYAVVWNKQKKMGLINRRGTLTVEMRYAELGQNYGELVPAKDSKGKYGYITPDGKVAITFKFDKASNFKSTNSFDAAGFAKVLLDEKTGRSSVVNKKGEVLQFNPAEVSESPGVQIYGDLAVVNYYNETHKKYFYAVINTEGKEILKNSDAKIQAWKMKDGTLIFIMKEKAMRLNGVKTCNPYDYHYFRVSWKGNVSPEDLAMDLISVYDKTGKVLLSRDLGYNFFTPGERYSQVGRAFSIDGKAAARFGLMDWNGKEALKTVYYEAAWNDTENIGLVGFDKMVRIGHYLDYVRSEESREKYKALEKKYANKTFSSKHFYFVNQNMKCIKTRLSEIKGSFNTLGVPEKMIDEKAIFHCKYVPKRILANYEQLKSKSREIISEGPHYEPFPFSLVDVSVEKPKPKIQKDGNFIVAAKQKKNFEFTADGLATGGAAVDPKFRFVLSRNGHIIPFSKKGEASPNYMNLNRDPKSSINSFYSWFDALQHSINTGLFLNYAKPDKSMTYSMRDWHDNTLIQADVKYRMYGYLYNGLLWLKEIRNAQENYVWNTKNFALTKIPVQEELQSIYQTADNRFVFPLTKDGKLYKLSLAGGSPKMLVSNVGWVFVFTNKAKPYLTVLDKSTKKYGVIDADGKTAMPRIYDHIQTNFNSENPYLFGAKGRSLFVHQIETGQVRLVKHGVTFNNGFRLAFGKYGVCQEGDAFILIDENGAEALRLKAEDFYGQPGKFSMLKQNGRWLFVDEAGKNPFGRDFVDIYPFHDGLSLVILAGEKNAFINTKGEFVIGPFQIHAK